MRILFNTDLVQDFIPENFNSLVGNVGLYFIFHNELKIPYPFKESRLIYMGMSESRINSIGNRLRDHYAGRSNNKGIFGYRTHSKLKFTYLDYEYLKHIFDNWLINLIEAHFINDFVSSFGCYPICNNQGYEYELPPLVDKKLAIDWTFFEGAK